ncbi:MAG: 4Fe-4S binding protein [Acidobacteria bacterium]|nr:4Fe-4S binding protein [Acidobacteriota bacterium]
MIDVKAGRPKGVVHSRASKWRAIVLTTLTALMVIHFVQWKWSGTTVSPIEPSEAMYTLQRGVVNAGFIFFTLAIIAALIFGRFICGWGCHIVALQDLCAWLLKKMGLKPRPFRSRLLVYVPVIVAFYMFAWPIIGRFLMKQPGESLFPEFSNHLITGEFWSSFPPLVVAVPFLFICGFMTVYFMGSKGFCTYACPYGAVWGIAERVAPGRIRATDACDQCGLCTAACTSNVLVHLEVEKYKMVVDPGCMKCMDCVSVCPQDALFFGFGKPPIGLKRTVKSSSLTWPEEIGAAIVFAFSFYAVWDIYQIVPMFMALGIAIVVTYLAMRSWRILTSDSVAFYKFGLVLRGKIRSAGWVFLFISAAVAGLILHSAWIRYHEAFGTRAFELVQLPDELALAQSDPSTWLTPEARSEVAKGRRHLELARKYGLFINDPALSKLAWLEFLSGNAERAVVLLGIAADRHDGRDRAINLYYRGAILDRLKRYDEGSADLDRALAERPDLIVAYEEKGEALWQLGRRNEAMAEWKKALDANESLPLAANVYAGALAASGDADAAAAQIAIADRNTPQSSHFHWMLGLRLQNLGMTDLAGKHFQKAAEMDPAFAAKRRPSRQQ